MEIANVMVFGIYRNRGIKIIKGSLILRFSFGKMFVSLQKRKLEKKIRKLTNLSLIDQRMEM